MCRVEQLYKCVFVGLCMNDKITHCFHQKEKSMMYSENIHFTARIIQARKVKLSLSTFHGTYERQERCITEFWWGDLRETPLGRRRHRGDDNIKMDLPEV